VVAGREKLFQTSERGKQIQGGDMENNRARGRRVQTSSRKVHEKRGRERHRKKKIQSNTGSGKPDGEKKSVKGKNMPTGPQAVMTGIVRSSPEGEIRWEWRR